MKTPVISIIVPVYNSEPYLRRCLDSIIMQTYCEFEIILIDDGSTDGSTAVCEDYASKDSRVKFIRQENMGIAATRNIGLSYISGQWVGWVDSDDWIEPDMLEYLVGLAETSQADIVQCGIFFEYSERAEKRYTAKATFTVKPTLSKEEWPLYSNQLYNKLYRRELLEDLNFKCKYIIGEDLLFNVDALAGAEKMCFADQAKYHYNQRGDSVCNRTPDIERLMSYRLALADVISRFEKGSDARAHFEAENLRNDLDICSKLVRFMIPDSTALEQEVRAEIKGQLREILQSSLFTAKERGKFYLIAKQWPLYRRLIPAIKKIQRWKIIL